jgi:hypothetical protein
VARCGRTGQGRHAHQALASASGPAPAAHATMVVRKPTSTPVIERGISATIIWRWPRLQPDRAPDPRLCLVIAESKEARTAGSLPYYIRIASTRPRKRCERRSSPSIVARPAADGQAVELGHYPAEPVLPAGPAHLGDFVPDVAMIPAQTTRDLVHRDATNEHLA